MAKRETKLSHLPAGLVFAALTLSVFVVSQGRGPQSAISLYHRAIAEGDRRTAAALVIESRPGLEKAFWDEIYSLYRTSRSLQYGRVSALGPMSEIDVAYDSQVYGLRPVKFILRKAPEGWRIDAAETLARTRESSLF